MALRVSARTTLVCAVVCALAAKVAGQSLEGPHRLPGGPVGIDHFGGNAGSNTVPSRSFSGLPGPDNFGFSTFVYPGVPGGVVTGLAPLALPNGAEIVQLCSFVLDSTWHGGTTLELIAWEYPAVPGAPVTPMRVLLTAATDGSEMPGFVMRCATPATPVRVGSAADIDGDGDYGWSAYALRVSLWYTAGGGLEGGLRSDGSVSLANALVWWRRTVSPAPATARFADVPTSHPLFRFVEALAASGISGGCDASSFCPDAPLTRGQMAVFLAVALGLHWMN